MTDMGSYNINLKKDKYILNLNISVVIPEIRISVINFLN